MKEVATIFDGKPGAPLELTLCLASSSPIASVARESVGPIKEGEARSVEGAQLSASGHGPLRAMKQVPDTQGMSAHAAEDACIRCMCCSER